ncbi:hypothetical protein NHQ30_006452 [Ciborinia camelliae]|nr:hypothetical protein NHQ30_006452 [Ciborinia camelliae]
MVVEQEESEQALRFLTSYLADGQYSASLLVTALQEAYGRGSLFGLMPFGRSGMKVAVTANTISDATLCLFSNYNGQEDHPASLSKFIEVEGYLQLTRIEVNHVRAANHREEVQIWEAFKEKPSSQNVPNVRNLFQHGALARLYRASMSSLSLDGDIN